MEIIPGIPDDIARECLIRIPYKYLTKSSAVCKIWRSEIQSVEFLEQRKVAGLSRNLIVMTQAEPNLDSGSGKYSQTPVYQLTLYEPESGVWERLPAIPGYLNGVPLFCQCAGVGRFLVVMGGWDPANWAVSNSVHVYDFVAATWRRGVDMPGPGRSFFACAGAELDGEDKNKMMVFVAGGHDEEKNALRSVLLYDVVEDKWISLDDMAKERDECKGLFHSGKFHVIGGYSSNMQGHFEGSVEAFDVAKWKWDEVEDNKWQNGVCPKTCVADLSGNIYKFSGDTVEVSNGVTWRAYTEMPLDLRVGTNVVMWKGKAMVIGSTAYGGSNVCYILEDGKWIKQEGPKEFTGHVQSGCALEI